MTVDSRVARSVQSTRAMRALSTLLLFASVSLVAVATGCSSSSDEEAATASWRAEPGTSGTRLRARYLSGGGGRELVGFFDTERNEECTFQRAENDRWRCYPQAPIVNLTGTFADAACRLPIAIPPDTCSRPGGYTRNAVFDGSPRCTTQFPTELRKVLADSPARYAGGPGSCSAQPASNAIAGAVPVSEVVPWTAFAEGVETRTPAGNVTEVALVTADGARQHLGFRIERYDVACSFQIMLDGVTRCVPEGGSGGLVYADAECTKPAFVLGKGSYGNASCAEKSDKIWIEPETSTACGGIRGVYVLSEQAEDRVGDSIGKFARDLRSFGSRANTTTPECRSTSFGGSAFDDRRAIEADITTSLPAADRILGGGGRLVPALVPGPVDGTLVPGWHDQELDADCSFALAADGKQRCLPAAASARLFFTDASCDASTRVAVLGAGGPCTGAPRFGRVTSSTCPVTTRVYALSGSAHDLTNASGETAPGRCASFAGVKNALDATEVDPAQFVEGLPEAE